MKSIVRSTAPFLVMLVVALGSVVVSCTTLDRAGAGGGEPFYINTGMDAEGRVFTTQVLARIDRIILVDQADKSRRTEMKPGEWTYDPSTTEIVLARPSPYRNAAFHVEGRAEEPSRFVLHDFQGCEEDIFIVVGRRAAIRDFDYSWDGSRTTLTFRGDLDLEKEKYMIRFDTSKGAYSMGNWEPDDDDQLAYLEAQHRTQMIRRWYRSHDADYFLDPSTPKGDKPRLVLRPRTAEENREIENLPVTVMKNRHRATDEAVSKEVGFDVRTPKVMESGGGGPAIRSLGKTVVETSVSGRLSWSVSDYYDVAGGVLLEMSGGPSEERGPVDERFVIAHETIDMGLPVARTLLWGTQGDLYGEPDVVRLLEYAWQDHGVRFGMMVDEAEGGTAERMIRAIVAYRRNTG